MSALVIAANDQHVVRGPSASGLQVPTQSRFYTRTLSALEIALQEIFSAEDAVDAVYAEQDEDTWRVFVVAEEHDDQVYEALLRAEDELCRRYPDVLFGFRVRAHQGRSPSRAVPLGALPLFLRDRNLGPSTFGR